MNDEIDIVNTFCPSAVLMF